MQNSLFIIDVTEVKFEVFTTILRLETGRLTLILYE
jgi:hypothetical protein